METRAPRHLWAKEVKALDGNKCVFCGETNRLEAHHIQQVAVARDKATVLENGVTLCHRCHFTAHGGYYSPHYHATTDMQGLFSAKPEKIQAFIANYAERRLIVTIPKGGKALIQAEAASQGKSINAYVREAIEEKLGRPFEDATDAD